MIEVDALDVHYGDFQALFGVSLSLARGRALALAGANGAGKTTLLRALMGAHLPSAGTVRYEGADVTALPPHDRVRRGIAMVPEGRRLFPSLTAEENIKVGAVRAASPDWPLARIYDFLPLAATVRDRRASALSGGERQAVAIARALASGPRLLLLDEISLGLAPGVVEQVYEVVRGLRESGATLLIVEQDLDRALGACDDVVCLLEGRVALTSETAAASREDVVAAYFGTEGPHS
ncbi:ABC transporter ATP-binding protein [Sphaerisporangium corydalis]|uniref:ABC transporter ATP-binding protein n=1 Tax=Sphaerisporangium corydalis TaxID=1441875 RepID=A0ABV9EJM0_9ACTN|nr:ATP-binding cassette domain-containing protein [Sphaerisporangium corydalis]